MLRKSLILVGVALLGSALVILTQLLQPASDVALLDDPEQIVFTHASGLYDRSFLLNVRTGCAEPQIALALDGEEPVFGATQPLPLELSVERPGLIIVRAKALCPNSEPTETIQGTYLVGVPHPLPIVSLVVDSADLYDPETGIFTNHTERGREWERAANLTVLEDETLITTDIGLRTHGAASNSVEKKSMRLYFRDEYGVDRLDYPLLGEDVPTQSFTRLVLSSGGQDNSLWSTNWTLLRTRLITTLAEEIGIPTAHARPVQLFINGQPQGIYLARNFLGDAFYRDKYGYDGVDEFEPSRETDRDWEEADELLDSADFSQDESVAQLAEYLNIEQLIDYLVLQMYIVNTDWTDSNYQMFRPHGTVNGSDFDPRWQTILWDVDFGLGLWYLNAKQTDMHAYLESDADPKLAAKIIFALFENEQFREQYAARVEELLDAELSPDNVERYVVRLANELRPVIDTEILRWGNSGNWEENVDRLREFARERPENMRLHTQRWLEQQR